MSFSYCVARLGLGYRMNGFGFVKSLKNSALSNQEHRVLDPEI